MKKALSVMMATAMAAAALTGCGGGSSSSSETQAPAANGGAAETKAAAASGEKAEGVFLDRYGMPVKLCIISVLGIHWRRYPERIPTVQDHSI